MNKQLETIGVIDAFESIIWTKRYFSAGDFELYLPAERCLIELLQTGNYIYRRDDETVMIIEKVRLSTDYETGNYLTISGRSLESVLARRIVWKQTYFFGSFEDWIYKLLNENAVEPAVQGRKILGLILAEKPGITQIVGKQLTGTNLYEAIVDACTPYKIGWKIVMNEDKNFVFSLYKGIDHSYAQSENPYVIFSPDFDNLLNSNYLKDTTSFANVALIAGEGEGKNRKMQTALIGTNTTGLNRFEIFVDARDISNSTESPMTSGEYLRALSERGIERLHENVVTSAFEGELETSGGFKYRLDWNVGDVVQIENEYGMTAAARITEVVESEDASGHRLIPTFGEWEVQE